MLPNTLKSRSGSDHRQHKNETVTFDKLLQHVKQHEATVKDFQ